MTTLSSFRRSKAIVKQKLLEGIDHIEALPPEVFLDAIRNMGKFVATEKLDGYNFWFGFDETGFYTSRGGKGGDTFRSLEDFSDRPAMNGFKSAHGALSQVSDILREVVQEGEIVEVEVLFGRQPNAIVYGDNMIAFLRFVKSNQEDKSENKNRIRRLEQLLANKKVTVKSEHTITEDGLTLVKQMQEHEWRFVSTAFMDSSLVDVVDLSKEADALESWLRADNDVLEGKTNLDILSINLGRVPKDIRPAVKAERERLHNYVLETFKLPIKQQLVSRMLRQLKPSLRTVEVPPDQDVGVEGLVFLDPDTNQQFKLVDKDVFTALNRFNFVVRTALKATGPMDMAARDEFGITKDDVSVFDTVVRDIGRALGISDNLRYFTTRAKLKSYGKTSEEIINNIAAHIDDLPTTKQVIKQSITRARKNLRNMLKKFQQQWKGYATTLPSGKTVTYNEDVYDRTMLTFAEVDTELEQLSTAISSVNSEEQLVKVLFARHLT